MIDRNHVAEEKMARAAELMRENGIDMWVVYSRLKTDTALELMFNTDTRNEVLFVLTADGGRFALCDPADAGKYESSGLYTRVIPVTGEGYMAEFQRLWKQPPLQTAVRFSYWTWDSLSGSSRWPKT